VTRYYIMSITLVAGLLAMEGAVHGQQPPNVVSSDASHNTAMGTGALFNLEVSGINGIYNTAAGNGALLANTMGSENVAIGASALQFNTTGNLNTASGTYALFINSTGNENTASGYQSLYNNDSGSADSAFGTYSLYHNTTGSNNTACGHSALQSNTVGNGNMACGTSALYDNTSGSNNTAVGPSAMYYNQTGAGNTALGSNALGTNRGGSNNIAVGANAGYYVRGGQYNIEIGNVGSANDAGTIRIGTSNQQTATYVAGITSAHVAGSAVYITQTGQLGVLASSERYKVNVASMGSSSENLKKLRPVTFRLKRDRQAGVQYGLIAEEVARVYPELVIRNEAGQAEGVRYEELTPMLLNEIQQLQEQVRAMQRSQAELRDVQQQLADLQEFRRSTQERTAKQ